MGSKARLCPACGNFIGTNKGVWVEDEDNTAAIPAWFVHEGECAVEATPLNPQPPEPE